MLSGGAVNGFSASCYKNYTFHTLRKLYPYCVHYINTVLVPWIVPVLKVCVCERASARFINLRINFENLNLNPSSDIKCLVRILGPTYTWNFLFLYTHICQKLNLTNIQYCSCTWYISMKSASIRIFVTFFHFQCHRVS